MRWPHFPEIEVFAVLTRVSFQKISHGVPTDNSNTATSLKLCTFSA
jgi:hypothetical protein